MWRRFLITLGFIGAVVTPPALGGPGTNQLQAVSGPVISSPPNREALLAVVDTVTVLDFATDRPVRQARLLVDGHIVGTTGAATTDFGLKVAVVPEATNIVIYLQVPSMGWVLHGDYPRPVCADLIEEKRYGPGKNLVLSNWTEVFGIQQKLGRNITYTMSVEVK
jgi:hypothetical protein